MDDDEKNATDDEGLEEYDHGFDQFLDEEEIDINTFVLPPRRKCPICTLPFPFDYNYVNVIFKRCCGHSICGSCDESTFYGELKRRIEDETYTSKVVNFASLQKCQFCRKTPCKQKLSALEKLAECGNGQAMIQLANLYKNGGDGVQIDYKRYIDLYHMAARADNITGCFHLGKTYWSGESFDDIVIEKDRDKAMRLFTRGARFGDPACLYCIGLMLCGDGKDDHVQYFLKAACTGLQEALDAVKKSFILKHVTKEEYAQALRSFQAVHDEINSEERTKFNKRLAAHETIFDLSLMSKKRQIEIVNKVLGPAAAGHDYLVLKDD